MVVKDQHCFPLCPFVFPAAEMDIPDRCAREILSLLLDFLMVLCFFALKKASNYIANLR
jgi:hypothetical protein